MLPLSILYFIFRTLSTDLAGNSTAAFEKVMTRVSEILILIALTMIDVG